jgi:hypothetical protein
MRLQGLRWLDSSAYRLNCGPASANIPLEPHRPMIHYTAVILLERFVNLDHQAMLLRGCRTSSHHSLS